MNRDIVIDTLRGLAIVCMLLSNLAGEVLEHPHPLLLRVFGSLAAPLFITISGYMLGIGVLEQKHNKSYFIVRGIFLCLIGAFIDLFSWKVLPFFWFDVLYLIGVSTVIVSFFQNFSFFYTIVLSVIMIISAPILQNLFGYSQPEYFELQNFSDLMSYSMSLDVNVFLKQWFISGWFPIFPWLGVFLLGVSISTKRKLREGLFNEKILILLGFLFFTGISIWNYEPKLENRGGYSELFYPPTLSYFLVFLSLSYFIYVVAERYTQFHFFSRLGQFPLFLYLSHLGYIQIVKQFLPSNIDKIQFIPYLFLFILGVFVLVLLVWIMQKLKPYTKKVPFPINMIFH